MTVPTLASLELDRAAMEMLLQGPCCAQDLQRGLSLNPSSVDRILRRIRDRGVVLEMVFEKHLNKGVGRGKAYYRARLGHGRVCAREGCCTVLRSTNPSSLCELHGGGTVDSLWRELEPHKKPGRVRTCTRCGITSDNFTGNGSYCRDCMREYKRERKLRAKVKETA